MAIGAARVPAAGEARVREPGTDPVLDARRGTESRNQHTEYGQRKTGGPAAAWDRGDGRGRPAAAAALHTAAAEERPSLMASRTRTVLIVDEDRTTRDRLSGILGRHYRVLVAATGEAAFALLMKEQAEIVLLDVCLPGISGLDALRILRENYPLSEVIMISALGDIELAVQAMKQGAYHYVTKDVEDGALLSLVQRAGEHLDLNRRVLS